MRWPWAMVSKIGALALVVYLGWQAWDYLGPRKPEIGPVRRAVIDDLVPQVVEDMRQARQGVRAAVLVHFANDPTDYVTDRLRGAIEQNGVLSLEDKTLGEKVRDGLRLAQPAYGDARAAMARAKDLGAEAVVYGSVRTLESSAAGVKVDMDVALADVATGQAVFHKQYAQDTSVHPLSLAAVQERTAAVGWPTRAIGWGVAILLLPVFTIGFIRTMVKKESNRTNAFVLSVYTAVAAFLAYLIIGVDFGSWLAILLFVVAVVAAFAYNVFVMTFALKLET